VLPTPQLYLIYWGTAWMPHTAPAPTAAEVTGAVSTLMASGYLTGLTQYRGTGHGALRGSTVITSAYPPGRFTDDQVAAFIDAQLSAGTIPGPGPGNQTVYGVVMPTGVTPESTGWAGEHHSYPRSGQKIHYAWFTNAGDLGNITAIISHELVESATDPDGSGFLGITRTCHGPGWCEIADICASTWASIDGITVHAYWSNQDNACIAPSSNAPDTSPPGARHLTTIGAVNKTAGRPQRRRVFLIPRPTGGRRKQRTTVMGTQRNMVTGIATAALALTACGIALPAGRRPGMLRCQRAMPRSALGSPGRGTSPGSSGTSCGWAGIPRRRGGHRRTRPGLPTSRTWPRSSGTSCCTPGSRPGAGRCPPGAGRGTRGWGPLGAALRRRAAASQVHGFSVARCSVRLASKARVRPASGTIRRFS
jgi:hypothetical protein